MKITLTEEDRAILDLRRKPNRLEKADATDTPETCRSQCRASGYVTFGS